MSIPETYTSGNRTLHVAKVKKQIVQLEENKKRAYMLVIRQCSPCAVGDCQNSSKPFRPDLDRI